MNITSLIAKTGTASWIEITDVPEGLSSALVARRMFSTVFGMDSGKVAAWMPRSHSAQSGPVYVPGSVTFPSLPRITRSYTWGQVFK